jgi:uncharacterized protein
MARVPAEPCSRLTIARRKPRRSARRPRLLLQALIRITLGTTTGLGTFWGTVMFRCGYLFIAAAFFLSLEGCSNGPPGPAAAVEGARDVALNRASSAPKIQPGQIADQTHTNSVSAISGEENSTYSRTVVDIATILDHNQLRFRPIASRGPLQDVLDLLQRPDVDIAIVQTDALEALTGRAQAAARERLRYLFRVPNKELHVLAPREIAEIRQLEGRKVNIDRPGSGTHLTARAIFEKLGIKPEFTTYDQAAAHQRLQSGEIQASISLASRSSSEILAFLSYGQFHLVSIPFEESVASYFPSQFTANDYPHLVDAGGRVETIAVGRVIAVRDWPEGSIRYRRLARLAETIYSRFDDLQQPGHDPRWGDVGLREAVPGWQRFKPTQNLLDQTARQTTDEQRAFQTFAAATGICSLPGSAVALERLYNDYVEWRRARDKNVLREAPVLTTDEEARARLHGAGDSP